MDGPVSVWLGLDLGGTNIKAAVLEGGVAAPRVLATDSCPTGAADGPDAVLERVAALGRAVAAPFGEPVAAGVALPGHFDAARGTASLLPNLLGDWSGRPIAGPVGSRLGLPVTLVNDVRALTLAELRLGAGRGARDLVCVALGTGVGGGVVIDGRLHLGLGHAGEIGHTTVDPDGPLCGCGNRGCLDRMASARSIADAAGRADVAEAAAAARAGDERARVAFARAGEYGGRVGRRRRGRRRRAGARAAASRAAPPRLRGAGRRDRRRARRAGRLRGSGGRRAVGRGTLSAAARVLEGADEHRADRPHRPEVAGAGQRPDGDQQDRQRDHRRDRRQRPSRSRRLRRRRQVGGERRQIAARAGRERLLQPLLELVGVEPAGGRMRPQRLGHALALGIGGEEVVWVHAA
jgi:glucokinase